MIKCLRYPDGKWYLKLGHGDPYDEAMPNVEAINRWYRNKTGNPEAVEQLSAFIQKLVPGMKVVNVTSGACVTCKVRKKLDYVKLFISTNGFVSPPCAAAFPKIST